MYRFSKSIQNISKFFVFIISTSLIFYPKISYSQNYCQQTINTITREIRNVEITEVISYTDTDKMNFLRNSVGKNIFIIGLKSSKPYLIDNILSSPVLMKNWVLKIIEQCDNVGYVMIGQYASSYNITYALNTDNKLFIYDCDDNPRNLRNADLAPEYSEYHNSYCAYVPFD